jgi:hypothetical protein
MGKAISLAALNASTLMINGDQYIGAKLFNFRSEFGQLLAIGKVSAKQNHAAGKWMQDTTAILRI